MFDQSISFSLFSIIGKNLVYALWDFLVFGRQHRGDLCDVCELMLRMMPFSRYLLLVSLYASVRRGHVLLVNPGPKNPAVVSPLVSPRRSFVLDPFPIQRDFHLSSRPRESGGPSIVVSNKAAIFGDKTNKKQENELSVRVSASP